MKPKSPTREAFELALSGVLIYLALHPEKIAEWEQWTQDQMALLKHRASVWRAILTIRSLPETDK